MPRCSALPPPSHGCLAPKRAACVPWARTGPGQANVRVGLRRLPRPGHKEHSLWGWGGAGRKSFMLRCDPLLNRWEAEAQAWSSVSRGHRGVWGHLVEGRDSPGACWAAATSGVTGGRARGLLLPHSHPTDPPGCGGQGLPGKENRDCNMGCSEQVLSVASSRMGPFGEPGQPPDVFPSSLVPHYLTPFWKALPFLILGRANLSMLQRVVSDVPSSRKTCWISP